MISSQRLLEVANVQETSGPWGDDGLERLSAPHNQAKYKSHYKDKPRRLDYYTLTTTAFDEM